MRRLVALVIVGIAHSTMCWGQVKEKPAPDVLVFTNGDQLTGKLKRVVGGSVFFKSEMAGELTVPLAKVKELRSATEFVALRKDAKKAPIATVGAVEVAGGAVVVTPASPGAAAERVDAGDLAFLLDRATYDREIGREPSFFRGWNGTVTGGASLVRSTQTETTLTAGAALVRAVPGVPFLPARNRTTLNLAETYGKQTTPVIPPTSPATAITVKSSIFHADTERDQYFSPRVYALADASFDHNFAQGMQLQQVYGAGVGWTAIKGAKQELDLKVDAHFERQAYFSVTPGVAAPPSIDLFGSTFGESYMRNFAKKIVFTENAQVLPAWNQANDYSANLNAMLALPVWKRLSASVAATDSFLNDPAPFYRKNSFQFTTGVTYAVR